MSDGHLHVEAALHATTILSPTRFSWFGRPVSQLPATVRRALGPRAARDYLQFRLQSTLYANLYCHGSATPGYGHIADGLGPARATTPLVTALSEANTGRGCWQSGWEVQAMDEDAIVACRGGLTIWLQHDECATAHGAALKPGVRLSVRLPKEMRGLSPGFYMALGDNDVDDESSEGTVVRFYWHLTPTSAVPFVGRTISLLNQAALPFRLKVLNDPIRFNRCDAGVVYVRKRDYAPAAELLCEVYRGIASDLLTPTPVFSKRMAPGLGLAEDPGEGASFGEDRCRLLADGLIRAYERGRRSVADRLEAVADRFVEAGLRLDQPFLNAGSHDTYEWPA